MARQDRTKSEPRYRDLFESVMDEAAEWVQMEAGRPRQTTTSQSHRISTLLARRLRSLGFDLPDVETHVSPGVALSNWLFDEPNKPLQRHGLGRQVPPKTLHYIGTTHPVFYDLHNADVLVDDLEASGLSFSDVTSGLDFGCSTGRTLRTFSAALPGARWVGVDPNPKSIDYAARRFPAMSWRVNPQYPPFELGVPEVDFLYAKSVWTHFSAQSGQAWLDELCQMVRVGGRVMITVHGWHDLSRRIVWGHPSPNYRRLVGAEDMSEFEYLASVVGDLRTNGFSFRPYVSADFQSDLRQIDSVTTSDWGLTFMTHDWIVENLIPSNAELVRHSIARNGHRHDVVVFERMA